jgi:hypothetical protein
MSIAQYLFGSQKAIRSLKLSFTMSPKPTLNSSRSANPLASMDCLNKNAVIHSQLLNLSEGVLAAVPQPASRVVLGDQ